MSRLILWWALVLFALPAVAQQIKLGFIDPDRIDHEAKRPQRDAEKLKKEFAAREQQLRELDKKVQVMRSALEKLRPGTPAAEADRKQREFEKTAQELEQTRRAFLEDVDRRKAEERQRFFHDLGAVVEKIAVAQGLDLVLLQAIYASPAINITDEVIKALDSVE